jgi:hypothetical protein
LYWGLAFEVFGMAKKSYEDWFKLVDIEVQKKVGLSANDLPDWPSRDWYDEGKTPKGAASAAIKWAKEF